MSYAANFGVVPQTVYAGCGARLVAALIDGTAIWVACAAALAGFSDLCALDGWQPRDLAGYAWVFRPLAVLLYFTAFEAGAGATPGKMMLLLRVQGADGSRAGVLMALGRTLAKAASILTLGMGFLLALWTGKHQALHDLMAGSVVVRLQ